ncbi:hypothetical protein CERSUDRAFT_76972 [Gelatoporia subvermispora B]|uniref:GED domain-containing protein n=1 Tax=Ceriporiopsis subvermispora (strain B) TaxID=914234 RepID=M2QL90_CERS8|nr:hypothetical protein CERSUDRAFT_76972 [Gelatoporia subvermispora B]
MIDMRSQSDDGSFMSTGGGVGLSDVQYSAGRRKMLDLINRLHSTGAQADIDLPLIAVIGQQSAGKSSLIESISGITLPRASGTCTRCPTECRLSYSEEPWRCIVSLRFTTDANGMTLGTAKNEIFGEPLFDKSQVEERIRRAQRAILNPTTKFRDFLDGPDENVSHSELSFSTNCVCLQISGNDVADLSFCDLPGLIASVGKGCSTSDIDLVKNLVTSYISKPSCIILLTVACETDFENQGAHHLAKTLDPDGKRTMGVLTKPDRIPSGEEDRWLRFVRNEYEALENGWFSVKQPDSRALAEGISWAEARQLEQEYFSMTPSWAKLESQYRQQLGTTSLIERLSAVLSSLITKRLPEVQDELQQLLYDTNDSLRRLPKPPSADALAEILHLLGDFSRDMATHLEGTPDEDGLLQLIRPRQDQFRKAIKATAPDFRPFAKCRGVSEYGDATSEDGLVTLWDGSISDDEFIPQDGRNVIYADEVLARAQKLNPIIEVSLHRAITRELPDHYPYVVTNEYITSVVCKWNVPTQRLFRDVQKRLVEYVKRLINKHFSKYAHGGLQQKVTLIVVQHIAVCEERAQKRIDWLLELEQRPWTRNDHYYSDYKDRFLARYRGARRKIHQSSLATKLEGYKPVKPSVLPHASDFERGVAKVLSGLNEINIAGVKASDLTKLLPTDTLEPALHIMAAVRAYFQVAYKRFSDYIPMALDHELVLGLTRGGGLDQVILQGLGITGADGYRRCQELLQEPPNILALRTELQKRRERLEMANDELMSLSGSL